MPYSTTCKLHNSVSRDVGKTRSSVAQKIKRSSPSRDLLSQFLFSSLIWLISVLALTGCHSTRIPGTLARRAGDEILVAGQLIHTGTRVVLWFDPGRL